MTNKAKTIAIRDSFVAAQFNKALGVNEPEAHQNNLVSWLKSLNE